MRSHTTEPVRRAVVGRVDIARQPLAPQRRQRWRLPRRVRRLLLGQLLLVALLLLLAECQKPVSLATSTLGDPRLVTGPVCLDEAVDVSGSMTEFTAQRERAERELFAFARRELEPSDTISVAFFAGSAEVAVLPTALGSLKAAPVVPPGLDYDDTRLAPAIDELVKSRSGAPSRCAARGLVIITDGVISDPQETVAALTRASYTRVYAVVPAASGWWRPPALGGDLSSMSVLHFTDEGIGARAASVFADGKPLDVVLGEVIGALTGQPLQRDSQPRQEDR